MGWKGPVMELEIDNVYGYYYCTPIGSYKGNVSAVVTVHAFMQKTEDVVSKQGTILLMCTIVSICVCLLLIFLLRIRLIKPVRHFVEKMKNLADGDLTGDVLIHNSCSEIIAISESAQAMKDNIRGVLVPIIEKTKETSLNTNKLAQVSIVVSEAAGNQAAALEQNAGATQVNSVIADLNRITQENAASAEEMASRTAEIQKMVAEMGEAIKVFKV